VVRTRVGYAGGTLEDPTYTNLGDHTETLQIDFDPEVITYEELLKIFWDSHDPTAPVYSPQYQSMILTHNDEQLSLALQSRDQQQAEREQAILTVIKPLEKFYLAEDYHQKYYLRSRSDLEAFLQQAYPEGIDWLNSTSVARSNGIAGGYTSWEELNLQPPIEVP
jgi:peptide-methionine (S)-S-oxide reductase